ncbi:MAG TPA: FIST N-terminal domain-containing protein [Miltoncostaeaceae bacterium]|nr:FIST N-terminal domain-containing protein [Miltoncostaeaceae bacterium]
MRETATMVATPRFAVAVSTESDPEAAAREAAARIAATIRRGETTLAAVFASPAIAEDGEAVLAVLEELIEPQHLIGCTTEAVVGAGREIEAGPALAVWCARLPGATVTPFRIEDTGVDDGFPFTGWPEELDGGSGGDPPVLLLADPYTFRSDRLAGALNDAGGPVLVGGLASGGAGPGAHRLFLDGEVLRDGAIGVAVAGAPMMAVVSQGCAPLGPDMVITAGGGSVVGELAGRPAFEKLSEVVQELGQDERRLIHQPLLAGIVIDENQPEYERGDFLVRGIVGRDADTGAIYIGERVRIGQTFRLHVRDAESADEDLRAVLRSARSTYGGALAPAGGLIFTCNGRGTHMFEIADHDATCVRDELADPPFAGMFCNGEIGPVGGRTFLHGFTATMALFFAPAEERMPAD